MPTRPSLSCFGVSLGNEWELYPIQSVFVTAGCDYTLKGINWHLIDSFIPDQVWLHKRH